MLARKSFTTKGFIDHVSREGKKPLRAEGNDDSPFDSQSVEVEIVPDKGEPNAIVRKENIAPTLLLTLSERAGR